MIGIFSANQRVKVACEERVPRELKSHTHITSRQDVTGKYAIGKTVQWCSLLPHSWYVKHEDGTLAIYYETELDPF